MPSVKSLFQRIPFIRITSLFLLGILIGQSILIEFYWIAIPLSLLILTLIFLWHNIHFSGVNIHNLLISSALFLSGIFYTTNVREKQNTIHDQKEIFVAEICQSPAEKSNSFQSILKIQSKRMSKSEKVIAYFSKERFDSTMTAGNQLAIYALPQEIKNTGNPYEFDFRSMMQNKGIYSSVYLSPGTYHKTGIQINRFIYLAEKLRDKLIVLLEATNLGDKERAVISALTLGYRTELDQETTNYFVDTGTIHVLSVSGFHVALIFFILSFIFSGINRGKFGMIIYPVLMILCLWSYAFITGFSPPVQRSTVMFSFMIIGSILRRPVNIYNSLTASALLLVLLEPFVLFDIGFQLSYLAIFGIVLLQPPLENLLLVKNKILRWIWTLFTVSAAAQLITFPLSIFYFNQFPNLFWLSNFLVIPGTTLIIWLTIGFFLLSPLAVLSNTMADVIQFITHQMLVLLKWISSQPHAVSEGIVYNELQTWILYGLILSFGIFIFFKNKTWLFGGLILLISFQASMLWTKFNLFNQQILYVYQAKTNLIHCINGRDSYIIKYDDIPYKEYDIHMIQNVCDHLKLKKPIFIDLRKTVELNTDDLKISKHDIYFLNCQIKYTDVLNFHIQGLDVKRFKMNNPVLFKKEIIFPSVYNSNLISNQKEAFSFEFNTPFKKAVYIFMN